MNGWRDFLRIQRKKSKKGENANKFNQYKLKKWVLESLSSFKNTTRLVKYQKNIAQHFHLQKSYEKFVGAICESLKRRHRKIQAIKHYANNVKLPLFVLTF
jgi:hypothetical protein